MHKPAAKLSILAMALATSLTFYGCSSTSKLVEPPMTPIESAYKVDKQWQVSQGALDKHDAEALVFAQDDSRIYVANNNGKLSALFKSNQSRWVDQIVWQTQFAERITSGPILDQGRLLVGTSKGKFKALSAEDGSVFWQSQLSSEVLSVASLTTDKIFTRTGDGKIYALSRQSGEVVWVSEHRMPKLSLRGAPAVIANDETVFVAWETGMLQALKAQSGELLWETRIAVPSGRTDLERMVDIQSNLVLKGETLYALGFHGKFVAINVQTGNYRFVKEISGYRDFVVGDSAIYLVNDEDVIQALDIYTGTQLWKQNSMEGRSINDLQMYDDALVVADAWGYIHWFNALQGTEFARVKHSNEYGDGNRIVRIAVDEPDLYLMDETGAVTLYQVEKSDLFQFREAHAQKEKEEALNIEPVTDKEKTEVPQQQEVADQKTDTGFSFSNFWPF